MSMQAASLDVLERANLPAPQARAIVQAIEIEMSAAHSSLATKQGLSELQASTKEAIAELRAAFLELRVEVTKIAGELRTEIQATAKETAWRMWVAIGAQTTILLGLGYFAFTHLKP
jgi:hypothetical protein